MMSFTNFQRHANPNYKNLSAHSRRRAITKMLQTINAEAIVEKCVPSILRATG